MVRLYPLFSYDWPCLTFSCGPLFTQYLSLFEDQINCFLSFVRGSTVEEARQFVIDRIPLKRAATAEDIADVVSFLVSEQASYMVGQAVAVTGGMELKS